MTPAAVRAFIAIEFSAGLRQRLAAVGQQLAQSVPQRAVKWVEPDLMHLTLKFLGDTAPAATPRLVSALDQVAAIAAPLSLVTSQAGCFPGLRQPRVIWIGLDSESAARLAGLAQAVEAATRPLGFSSEPRPFSAHITLGRVRREAGAPAARKVGEAVRALGSLPPFTETISALTLIKSDLRLGGPVYTAMHTARFAAAREQ